MLRGQQVTGDRDERHRRPVPDALHQELRRGRAHLVARRPGRRTLLEAPEGGGQLRGHLAVGRQAHEVAEAQGEHGAGERQIIFSL